MSSQSWLFHCFRFNTFSQFHQAVTVPSNCHSSIKLSQFHQAVTVPSSSHSSIKQSQFHQTVMSLKKNILHVSISLPIQCVRKKNGMMQATISRLCMFSTSNLLKSTQRVPLFSEHTVVLLSQYKILGNSLCWMEQRDFPLQFF